MSFFTRKPNPPVPSPAAQAIQRLAAAGVPAGQIARMADVAPLGPIGAGQLSPVTQNETEKRAPSNNRFRSFAERYIVERCRDWKEGEIDERAWAAILEAKSIYNKVREVGRTLQDDS